MNTSKDAVNDYLNAMFMDVTLSESVVDTPDDVPTVSIQPNDSVPVGARVVSCLDPFQLMDLKAGNQHHNQWLALTILLQVSESLPRSAVKSYCLNQYQILYNKWNTGHSGN
jgi:hypothetical protein